MFNETNHPAIYEHQPYKCKCGLDTCGICRGAIMICNICGGIEGTLSTDCPGRMTTAKEQEDIYKERIDYRNGLWVQLVIYYAAVNEIPTFAYSKGFIRQEDAIEEFKSIFGDKLLSVWRPEDINDSESEVISIWNNPSKMN